MIRLEGDAVVLLDQTRLPGERVERRCTNVPELCLAIRELAIRGAPAIGIAAAMGMAQAARSSGATDTATLRAELADARARLAGSRPTAVNLGWALERCDALIAQAVEPTSCECRSRRSRVASTRTRSRVAARWDATAPNCSRRVPAC